MNTLFVVGRIVIYSVLAFFWLSVLITYLIKKDNWLTIFSGIKKILSTFLQGLVIFVLMGTMIWDHKLSIMTNNFSAGWVYASSFLGYALVLVGLTLAMKTVVILWKPLPSDGVKNQLYKKERNSVFLSLLLISVGSSFVVMNTVSLVFVILIMLPFFMLRAKIENKANAII